MGLNSPSEVLTKEGHPDHQSLYGIFLYYKSDPVLTKSLSCFTSVVPPFNVPWLEAEMASSPAGGLQSRRTKTLDVSKPCPGTNRGFGGGRPFSCDLPACPGVSYMRCGSLARAPLWSSLLFIVPPSTHVVASPFVAVEVLWCDVPPPSGCRRVVAEVSSCSPRESPDVGV